MQVEIINPQGNVSYCRPHDHPDVAEALRTKGYSIRFPNCRDIKVLDLIPCVNDAALECTIDKDGVTMRSCHE